jgi:cytidylate kinase
MQSAHIELITVSREFGAGGSELARRLGERLGWPVLDDDVACRCAKRLHMETSAVEKLREHSPTLLARLSAAFLVAPPEASGIDFTNLMRIDAIAEAALESITDAAKTLPLIVVGFGTQCIFAQRTDALHVRIVAPMATRVARLSARYGWDATTAATRAQRMDEDRRRYLQRYFHRDMRDPLLYDVQINTGRTTIDEAASLIERLVRGESELAGSTAQINQRGAGAIA